MNDDPDKTMPDSRSAGCTEFAETLEDSDKPVEPKTNKPSSRRKIGLFVIAGIVVLTGLIALLINRPEVRPPPSRTGFGTLTLPGDVKLELVKIPAGSFTMGSPLGESGRYNNETRHRVTLTKDFWLGKYEVTQAQYEALIGSNPSYFKGANLPVEQVTWDDAMAYCRKLNERFRDKLPAGYEFSLPTEAQWEYACRAGTTTAFHYGDSSDVSKMNYDGNYPSGGGAKGIYREKTVPVGSLRSPNAWGLHDMHGNVWEWCYDRYGRYGGDATDPVGAASGSFRVNRGGSWIIFARFCRSARRYNNSPGYRSNYLGFRVALRPVQ